MALTVSTILCFFLIYSKCYAILHMLSLCPWLPDKLDVRFHPGADLLSSVVSCVLLDTSNALLIRSSLFLLVASADDPFRMAVVAQLSTPYSHLCVCPPSLMG